MEFVGGEVFVFFIFIFYLIFLFVCFFKNDIQVSLRPISLCIEP